MIMPLKINIELTTTIKRILLWLPRAKKNTNKTPWELAWEARKYPARLDEGKDMPKADVAFCLLMWFGMSQVDAFILAYRPRANRASVAAMACRRSKEEWCIEYLSQLSDLWYKDKLKFG